MVLAILHLIPWKFTVVVFSRDIGILGVSAWLFAIAGLRDFRPSILAREHSLSNCGSVFVMLFWCSRAVVWLGRHSF